MKNTHSSLRMSLLAVSTAICITLSGCGLDLSASSSKAAVKKDIIDVVDDYLEDVQSGTFAKDGYSSDYTLDMPFAKLSFVSIDVTEQNEDGTDSGSKDQRRDIMDASFDNMSYEIEDAEGSIKDEEGTCDVIISAVDVEAALSDIGLDDMTPDSVMDAITDRHAPTDEYDITFELTYDDDSEEWIISDSSELAKVLGEPFEDFELTRENGSPQDVVTSFILALQEEDIDSVNMISPYYDSTYFWPEDYVSVFELMNAFYKSLSFSFSEEPDMYDMYADVNVLFNMVDFEAIFSSTAEDVDFNAQILKPYLLNVSQDADLGVAYDEYLNAFLQEVAVRMQAADAPFTTVETFVSLEINPETNSWEIYSLPYELYAISYYGNSDPYYYASTDLYNAGFVLAAQQLFQEGLIKQDIYDSILEMYGDGSTGGNYNSTDVYNDINYTEWYDYASSSNVTSYEASTTYTIEFDIYFYSEWTGLTVYYDFYNENGTVLCKTTSDTILSGENYIYAWYETEDSTSIPADTYRVVVYLADDTILAEEHVTVS